MYLKEIEIQDSSLLRLKVVLTKVTAVAGPNGSGKSNITESLRWALGESCWVSSVGADADGWKQKCKPLNYVCSCDFG